MLTRAAAKYVLWDAAGFMPGGPHLQPKADDLGKGAPGACGARLRGRLPQFESPGNNSRAGNGTELLSGHDERVSRCL